MVFQLNGAAAMQTVPHYHMHLMPRTAGEPLALHSRVPGQTRRETGVSFELSARSRLPSVRSRLRQMRPR
jgi:histidine triad (HIT) family protein